MSAPLDRPRRRRRQLTADERALWKTVTRSVAPLRSGAAAAPEPEEDLAPGAGSVASRPPVPARTKTAPRVERPAPPLAPLGRRLKQRVARGSEPIDARLDLHGLTQEAAHRALRRFLRAAQGDGVRLALVITGKGARGGESFGGGEERGVLKRLVPQWLRLPEFRSTVVGFEPAHVSHGGEGALYVRIRRAKA